jgi:hypothetical protein
MAKKKRTYNPNLIKAKRSYTIMEIAEIYTIHKRTAQTWIKEGLSPLEGTRSPYLILGEEIKRFIKEKAKKHKHHLMPDEFFCPKCQKPRKSHKDKISYIITDKKLGKSSKQIFIKGVCQECNTSLTLFSSDKKLEQYKVLLPQHKVVIISNKDNSLSTDIKREVNDESKCKK